VKDPFAFVTVPIVVHFIITEALASPTPLSSVTLPEIVLFCAAAKMNELRNAIKRKIFFISM